MVPPAAVLALRPSLQDVTRRVHCPNSMIAVNEFLSAMV